MTAGRSSWFADLRESAAEWWWLPLLLLGMAGYLWANLAAFGLVSVP